MNSPIDLKPSFADRIREPGAGTFVLANRSNGTHPFRRFLSTPMALVGAILLLTMMLIAVFGPFIRPGDPLRIVGGSLIPPLTDPRFPLGTDSLGRDLLAGILHGARVSIAIGIAVATTSLIFGVILGAIAGYLGGIVDAVICRFIELFQTIPGFVLLVVLVSLMEPSSLTVVIGLTLVSWDTVARLARAEVRQHRNRDYVQAAETFGFSHSHILFREILPNIAPSLIVTASIIVANAILSESALSFLGLGDPNTVTWGSLIGYGRDYVRSAWYLSAIPGVFIAASVLSLNLLGDALNDFFDPRGGN